MSEILVLTCPSGKTCSALLPLLTSPPTPRFTLRLAAHTQRSADALCALYPSAEVLVGDLASYDYCARLLDGASAVFFVGPSLHSREREMAFNMVDAAVAESRRAGSPPFRHFVYSSVLGPHMRKLVQHNLKSYVEERLMLSPLAWTVVQLTNFMEALPVALLARMEHPTIERLWDPHTANSQVSFRDVAEAVAKILHEREPHYFATYPLSSTFPLSDAHVCRVIESRIGKPVAITRPTFERAVEKVLGYLFAHTQPDRKPEVYVGHWRGEGEAEANSEEGRLWMPGWEGDPRPDMTRDGAERLVLFYSRHGLPGNPNVLRWLLGREPTTIEEWVDGELERVGFKRE